MYNDQRQSHTSEAENIDDDCPSIAQDAAFGDVMLAVEDATAAHMHSTFAWPDLCASREMFTPSYHSMGADLDEADRDGGQIDGVRSSAVDVARTRSLTPHERRGHSYIVRKFAVDRRYNATPGFLSRGPKFESVRRYNDRLHARDSMEVDIAAIRKSELGEAPCRVSRSLADKLCVRDHLRGLVKWLDVDVLATGIAISQEHDLENAVKWLDVDAHAQATDISRSRGHDLRSVVKWLDVDVLATGLATSRANDLERVKMWLEMVCAAITDTLTHKSTRANSACTHARCCFFMIMNSDFCRTQDATQLSRYESQARMTSGITVSALVDLSSVEPACSQEAARQRIQMLRCNETSTNVEDDVSLAKLMHFVSASVVQVPPQTIGVLLNHRHAS